MSGLMSGVTPMRADAPVQDTCSQDAKQPRAREMNPEPRVRLSLELDLGANPVSGRLDGPEHQTRTFSGYIELLSLIEDLRRIGRAAAEEVGEQ
jgi:hypothetical protein